MELEIFDLICVIIAIAAVGIAFWYGAQASALRTIAERQRQECIGLAKACGRFIEQRQIFLTAKDLEKWLAEPEGQEFEQDEVPL